MPSLKEVSLPGDSPDRDQDLQPLLPRRRSGHREGQRRSPRRQRFRLDQRVAVSVRDDVLIGSGQDAVEGGGYSPVYAPISFGDPPAGTPAGNKPNVL